MKTIIKHQKTIIGLLFINLLTLACSPKEAPLSTSEPSSLPSEASPEASPSVAFPATQVQSLQAPITYGEVFKITYSSCLPCHNRNTLPQIIERVKASNFTEIDGEPRLRILGELEGLKAIMDESPPFSFSSGQTELIQFFNAFPGAFYTMLEKGVMPPPWAPELMQTINWPNYTPLSIENRSTLLQFSKPYSEKYLYKDKNAIKQPAVPAHGSSQPATEVSEDMALLAEAKLHFKALVLPQELNPFRVELGKMLYYDPRLSKSGTISCNSCHSLSSYGVDNRPVSIGHNFQRGTRNAPTVLNARLNFAQFWDGRAKDLAEQAEGPILNPIEMAMPDEITVVKRLESIPEYVEAFKRSYPDQEQALTYKNMAQAIASFEETLMTPSRFDQFLSGDTNSLSEHEQKGLKLFINKGCIACHNGPGLGGESYQLFGVQADYQYQKDLGRFDATQIEKDKFLFKVPLLRNIEKTYPYFHDGKIWDLKEAVQIMGRTALGKEFSSEESNALTAFLKSLTGELPESAKTLPILPASSRGTSQPEH